MPEVETQTDKPRPVHTDGWNSYWHVILGILAARIPLLVIPLFLAYQLYDMEELNVAVDILEFLIGLCTGICLRVFFI
jgi:hypothetical protein